jgi:hypothetical protein
MNTKQKLLTLIALAAFGWIVIEGQGLTTNMWLTYTTNPQIPDIERTDWGLSELGARMFTLAVFYVGLFFVLSDRKKVDGE